MGADVMSFHAYRKPSAKADFNTSTTSLEIEIIILHYKSV